jgi:hypothetical protein
MGHVAVWKILEQMIADFREKAIDIPAQIIVDLKSAKTMLRILEVEPTNPATLQKIEQYLMNVESYLVSEGQKKLGFTYADEWLKRVEKAGKEKGDENEEDMRFIPGVPRQQKWIRVTPSQEMSIETLEATAHTLNLSFTLQKDGSLLVCGEDQGIRDFVKKMASKYQDNAEKYRKKVHNG